MRARRITPPTTFDPVELEIDNYQDILLLRALSWVAVEQPGVIRQQMSTWGRNSWEIPTDGDIMKFGSNLQEALKIVASHEDVR